MLRKRLWYVFAKGINGCTFALPKRTRGLKTAGLKRGDLRVLKLEGLQIERRIG